MEYDSLLLAVGTQ